MKLFGKKRREIERLNKALELLLNDNKRLYGDINELIDKPDSEMSIQLMLTRRLELDIQRMMWQGEVGFNKPLNFEGININIDPMLAIVNIKA
jgi:hypothetical protein